MSAESDNNSELAGIAGSALSQILMLIGLPMLGLGGIAAFSALGLNVGSAAEGKNAASIFGFAVLGILATAGFFVLSAYLVVKELRRKPSKSSKEN